MVVGGFVGVVSDATGTAVVKAGVVDDLMIVLVTLTALGLFTTPAFELTAAWRWLFWALIVGAYIFGIFGMVLVTVVMLTYLCSLESFGVPYLYPIGPLNPSELGDTWIQLPPFRFLRRPRTARPVDVQQASPPPKTGDPHLADAQAEVRR